jgi:iron complex transport system substrate-binding protein
MNIVSLLPSATEIAASLGLGNQLVGITHSCDYPSSVLGLPRVTSTAIPKDAPSREIDTAVREMRAAKEPLYEIEVDLLERLQPDILITQGICDVCAVCEMQAFAAVPKLSKPPAVVNLAPHRITDVLEDVLRVGQAGGVRHVAQRNVAAYLERMAAVAQRIRGKKRKTVVVLEWIDPPFSCGHWTPDVVAMAGGLELLAEAGHRSRQLHWEEIRKADPEVLVIACCGQDVDRTMSDWGHLKSQAGFEDLQCVRNDQVFVADGATHFSRPSPRLIDSLELLAESLHPSGTPGLLSLRPIHSLV